jgi:hypothetical protein
VAGNGHSEWGLMQPARVKGQGFIVQELPLPLVSSPSAGEPAHLANKSLPGFPAHLAGRSAYLVGAASCKHYAVTAHVPGTLTHMQYMGGVVRQELCRFKVRHV